MLIRTTAGVSGRGVKGGGERLARAANLVKILLWTGPGIGETNKLAKNQPSIKSGSPDRPQNRCAASPRTCFEAGRGFRILFVVNF